MEDKWISRQHDLVGLGWSRNDALLQAMVEEKVDFQFQVAGEDCTELLMAGIVLDKRNVVPV
jgi:hypothetical protein